ncbi:unnamed protein product [Nippostrongylus brasiliensis]|uniref:PB1 domain-containing protein n=1 Tax=Nippostrongylus brasiliensis TaxID=27835 RepID=A0A0N4XWT4_NIPBR|nr:unnamed protein product [Nippostrongylus brasiliensis]
MPDSSFSSSLETKTVTFKLYLKETARITITYKDEDDLFEQFKKTVEDYGAALHYTYRVDDDWDLATMRNSKIVQQSCAKPVQVLHLHS